MKIHFKFLLVLVAIVGTIPFSFSQRGGASNPTITVQADIQHITDEITSGEIDYEILVSTGWTRSTRINSLKIINSDGQLVHTHAGSGPLGLAQGLPIGYYEFTGSITVQNSAGYYTSMSINERVWIGREAMWCDSKDMNVAFDNTITRNASSITYAGARSNNIIQEGDGWIQLNGKYGSGSNSRSFLVLGNTQDISSFSPNSPQQFIEFYSTSSGNGIRIKYKTTGGSYLYTTISNNPSDAVRLIRNGSNVSVQIRNNKYASFNFPTSYTGVLNIGVFANEVGDGFKNVITSLPGGSALASWDGDLNTGIINVDISNLGVSGPYSYMISEGKLQNKSELYDFLSESVGLNLNEEIFNSGNNSSTYYSEYNLEENEYFVNVYNNEGFKIYTKRILVQRPLELLFAQSITTAGNLVKAHQYYQSHGVLDLFVVENINSEFEFRKMNVDGNGFFGISPVNITPSNYTQLTYGFYFANGTVYSVKNGELSNGQNFASADFLKIKNDENQIILELSNTILVRDPLNGTIYKTSVGLSKGNTAELKGKGGGKGSVFISVDTKYSSCFGAFGSIEVFPSVSSSSVAIQATRLLLDGTSINSSANNSLLFENLVPGLYLVEVDFTENSGSTQTSQKYVLIESTINWANYVSTAYNQSNESLTRSSGGTTLYGTAKANHKLSSGANTVYFRVLLPGNSNWTGINWSDQVYGTSNLSTMTEGIVFINNNGGILAVDIANNLSFSVTSNNRFIYTYNNGNATLQKSLNLPVGPTIISHSVTSSEPKFNVFPGLPTSGIYEVLTNMECNIPNQYAEVKRKITGVKYKVYLNEVLFYMDEEYLDSDTHLTYKVYSSIDRVSPVLGGTTDIVNSENRHGDNRYMLDVQSLSPGAYLLVVENQKKEKFYLRFIK